MTERVWFIVLDCGGFSVRDEWDNEPDVDALSYTERHFTEQYGRPCVVTNVFSVPRG